MGVSFGEVIGDVQPDGTEASAPATPESQGAPPRIDPIALRREIARLDRRRARLRAS